MSGEGPGDCQPECRAIGDCNYFTWIRLVLCQGHSQVSPMARKLSGRMQCHRRLQLLHMDKVSLMSGAQPGESYGQETVRQNAVP
jgi:hypothetical protein